MVSSANCRIDILVLFLPTKKPSVNPFSSALNISLLNTLATKVRKKGERGSPCLNPLDALIHPLVAFMHMLHCCCIAIDNCLEGIDLGIGILGFHQDMLYLLIFPSLLNRLCFQKCFSFSNKTYSYVHEATC